MSVKYGEKSTISGFGLAVFISSPWATTRRKWATTIRHKVGTHSTIFIG